MEITVRKIKATKSVIEQIQYAGEKAIMNQDVVLGWCQWTFGSGKMKKVRKLILFLDNCQNIFKMIVPDDIEKRDQYELNRQMNPESQIEKPWFVRLRKIGFSDQTFAFETKEDQNEFFNLCQRLKRVALEQGQFFI